MKEGETESEEGRRGRETRLNAGGGGKTSSGSASYSCF